MKHAHSISLRECVLAYGSGARERETSRLERLDELQRAHRVVRFQQSAHASALQRAPRLQKRRQRRYPRPRTGPRLRTCRSTRARPARCAQRVHELQRARGMHRAERQPVLRAEPGCASRGGTRTARPPPSPPPRAAVLARRQQVPEVERQPERPGRATSRTSASAACVLPAVANRADGSVGLNSNDTRCARHSGRSTASRIERAARVHAAAWFAPKWWSYPSNCGQTITPRRADRGGPRARLRDDVHGDSRTAGSGFVNAPAPAERLRETAPPPRRRRARRLRARAPRRRRARRAGATVVKSTGRRPSPSRSLDLSAGPVKRAPRPSSSRGSRAIARVEREPNRRGHASRSAAAGRPPRLRACAARTRTFGSLRAPRG